MLSFVRRLLQRRPLVALAAAGVLSATTLVPAQAISVTPVRLVGAGVDGHAGLYGWGAATMLDGSVLIGDYWNMRVQRYATDGTLLGTFIDNPGFGPGQHQAPYGLAVDPTTGDVYMADTDRYRVNKYDDAGTFLLSFGVQGTDAGKFKYPSRIAVSSTGMVYVADTWDNRISIHTPDGTEIGSFGGSGATLGQLRAPHGMAFDAADRLFVADARNNRIQVFDATGTALFAFSGKGYQPGNFVGDMRGLAIDQANGFVYASDGIGNRINKFTTDGTYVSRFGSSGFGPGQFSDGGREVTVDGDGSVWVGDMPNFRAQKFAADGTFLFEVPGPPAPPLPGGFNAPRGVAVDNDGNIFVTDTYNWRIQKLAPNGDPVTSWGTRGQDEYRFNYSRMLAIDPRNGDVVVADTDNQRIKKYTNDGLFIWQKGGAGRAAGQFQNPHGVDVGPDGTIYVADTNNDRVVVLDEHGTFVRKFGSTGSANGQFQFPKGIGVDPDGTLWVTDSIKDTVQHFTAEGTYLGKIGTHTAGAPDQLAGPFDVEIDAERVFVADAQLSLVKVWSRDGTYQGSFGGPGRKLGKFLQPQGMDLTPGGQLYVAEQKNDRVQEWSVSAG